MGDFLAPKKGSKNRSKRRPPKAPNQTENYYCCLFCETNCETSSGAVHAFCFSGTFRDLLLFEEVVCSSNFSVS
jgi:hypothetical protein